MKKLSDNELLVRIDERQIAIKLDISDIKKCLTDKVTNDDEYKEVCRWAEDWRDTKNKALGYLVGASVGGGVVANLISGIVKAVLAR